MPNHHAMKTREGRGCKAPHMSQHEINVNGQLNILASVSAILMRVMVSRWDLQDNVGSELLGETVEVNIYICEQKNMHTHWTNHLNKEGGVLSLDCQ